MQRKSQYLLLSIIHFLGKISRFQGLRVIVDYLIKLVKEYTNSIENYLCSYLLVVTGIKHKFEVMTGC